MRKVLTLLILLSLFVGMAGAVPGVTISKTPTFNWGPSQGMKNVGTIPAGDLYATDDLEVGDDADFGGDVDIAGTLTVPILSPDATTASNELGHDLTVLDGTDITAAAGAEIFDYALSTAAFTTSTGTNTLSGNTVIAGTKTFGTGTGAVSINGATTFAANKGIAMTAGTGAMDFSLGTGVFKTTAGAATIGPGAVGVSGDATFSKTVAYSLNATTTVSTTIDATATKTVYGIDASGGHVTFTLPDASTVTGRLYMIATAKDMAANNIIVATTGAGKIGGESGADTLTSTDATAALSVISNGTHYFVVSKVGAWT